MALQGRGILKGQPAGAFDDHGIVTLVRLELQPSGCDLLRIWGHHNSRSAECTAAEYRFSEALYCIHQSNARGFRSATNDRPGRTNDARGGACRDGFYEGVWLPGPGSPIENHGAEARLGQPGKRVAVE